MEESVYKGIVGKVKDAQKMMNMSAYDLTISLSIEGDFNQWFEDNFEFKFGMRWSRKLFRSIALKAYIGGYKLSEQKERQAIRRSNYEIAKLAEEHAHGQNIHS